MDSAKLVIFIPDSSGDPGNLDELINLLREQNVFRGALFEKLNYSLGFWKNADLGQIASSLSASIENLCLGLKAERTAITLCGYSLGSMLARRAYLDAKGLGSKGLARSWADSVERIVLLGAICRGFDSARMGMGDRLLFELGKNFGFGKAFGQAVRGANFASNVRVDWISLWNQQEDHPTVVNILGTKDPIVNEDDVIDLLQHRGTSHIRIPNSNHDDVILPRQDNKYLLIQAFCGDENNLPQANFPKTKIYSPSKKVYFLLHGMRASQDSWRKLASSITKLDEDAIVVNTGYGYIPIASFLSRSYRQSQVSEFVDEYAQLRAANPEADFYFVGHSNGTCLLGQALISIPRMQFKRVFLGGSALPTTFDWAKVINERNQVSECVRSDRGSKDWIVGILAKGLERISNYTFLFRGIGSGGYDGFRYGVKPKLFQPLVDANHSTIIDDHERILHFLISKDSEMGVEEETASAYWISIFGKIGDLVILSGLVLYFGTMILCLLSYLYPIELFSPLVSTSAGLAMMAFASLFFYRY